MPHFAYRALTTDGKVTSGLLAAANENALAAQLGDSGLELISVKERKNSGNLFVLFQTPPPDLLADASRRIGSMLDSGLSLPMALREAAETCENPRLREALSAVQGMVENGGSPAASFARYPALFPEIFSAFIAAGEASGKLGTAFAYAAAYLKRRADMRGRLRRALRYPAFLFLVSGGAVAFMAIGVIPQIVLFLNGLQTALPPATRALIALADFVAAVAPSLLTALVIFLPLAWLGRHLSPTLRTLGDAALLRLPSIGPALRKASLARFAQCFSLLFRCGLPVMLCLKQAGNTIDNSALRQQMALAEIRVGEGASFSQALQGALPFFAIGLIRAGERSGDLCRSLDDLADAYDREAQASIDSFIGMLEPALTLLIGALLAWTALAVLGPLYGSLSSLGGRL